MMKLRDTFKTMSKMRRRYTLRLVGRCIVLLCSLLFWLWKPETYEILNGWNFFLQPSILHMIWLVWVVDMVVQLAPVGKDIPLGSQKLFKIRFVPIREKINRQALKHYVNHTTRSAGLIMLLWIALIAAIGVLHRYQILNDTALFMITVLFYVCDLICVLVWCPFRLILGTRCCTTCRIFNWDHLMMFTPMIFVKGFYSWSLLLMSFAAWMVWEINVFLHPERFWDHTNAALLCSNCTDKLCTQYCKKLRPTDS